MQFPIFLTIKDPIDTVIQLSNVNFSSISFLKNFFRGLPYYFLKGQISLSIVV